VKRLAPVSERLPDASALGLLYLLIVMLVGSLRRAPARDNF
jgi:hypothetical protein